MKTPPEAYEVDALSSFDGFDAERRGKMTLAGSRWAEEMHGLVSIDEAFKVITKVVQQPKAVIHIKNPA